MCMQNFITIFHSVQEIGPFSLFQNLKLGKTSTDEKCHFANSWARSFNINVYAKVDQNIPLSSRDKAIFTFQNFALGKASIDVKWHSAIVSLFSEFKSRQKLNQSRMPFDNLMGYILSISICMQNFITIFHSVQEIGPFSLFQNFELSKASTDGKFPFAISWARSCQYHVYAKVYQNIPLSSRDRAIFTFSEFGARQSLDRW